MLMPAFHQAAGPPSDSHQRASCITMHLIILDAPDIGWYAVSVHNPSTLPHMTIA